MGGQLLLASWVFVIPRRLDHVVFEHSLATCSSHADRSGLPCCSWKVRLPFLPAPEVQPALPGNTCHPRAPCIHSLACSNGSKGPHNRSFASDSAGQARRCLLPP